MSVLVSCLVYVSVIVLHRSMIFCFYENGFVQFILWNGSWIQFDLIVEVRKFVIVFFLSPLNSGKGGRFSGGFDISVMQKVHQTGKLV